MRHPPRQSSSLSQKADPHSKSMWLPIASICVIAAVAQFALGTHDTPPPSNRPIQKLAKGFVGSSECMSCHPSEYASWHDSYHRTMTQVATPATVAGNTDEA